MGRHVRSALMLLYVLQLAIVFRDQLGHLYAHAVEAVRHEKTSHDEPPRPHTTEGPQVGPAAWWRMLHGLATLTAPHLLQPVTFIGAAGHNPVIHGDHGHGHFHPQHHFHENASHERHRHRRVPPVLGFLLRNRYADILALVTAPSAVTPRVRAMLRVMTFAA